MQYRSVADLNDTIVSNLHKLPSDIDAVVGVPRSGLLAAQFLCLALNVPLADVDGFLEGRVLATGKTRKTRKEVVKPKDMRTVVVIDDSVNSGKSMRAVREQFAKLETNTKLIFCAVYGVEKKHNSVDVVLDRVALPRLFQWNIMHHASLQNCCVDIDGVLCLDPTQEQNDDGPAYEDFLKNAVPMHVPSVSIGALVTSRLEKYRDQTVQWMAENNIKYDELHMLDLPTQQERIRLNAYGSYKAKIYKESDAVLFIESDYIHAKEIAQLSQKPVLCIETQHVIYPEMVSALSVKNLPIRLRNKARHYKYYCKYKLARMVLGERGVEFVKGLIKK